MLPPKIHSLQELTAYLHVLQKECMTNVFDGELSIVIRCEAGRWVTYRVSSMSQSDRKKVVEQSQGHSVHPPEHLNATSTGKPIKFNSNDRK